jgi:hypothetical protein
VAAYLAEGRGKHFLETQIKDLGLAGTDVSSALLILVVISILASFGQYFLSDAVWLPAERIVLVGRAPMTAYVVNETTDWATVLVNSDRTIEIVKTSEISARAVCRPQSQPMTALQSLHSAQGIPDAVDPCP